MKLYTGRDIIDGNFNKLNSGRYNTSLLLIDVSTNSSPEYRILTCDNKHYYNTYSYKRFYSLTGLNINHFLRELSRLEFQKYYAKIYREYLLIDIPLDILELLDNTIRTNYSGGVNKYKKYK